jgi:hypothetical protein
MRPHDERLDDADRPAHRRREVAQALLVEPLPRVRSTRVDHVSAN